MIRIYRKYIYIVLVVILILLGIGTSILYTNNLKLKLDLSISKSNEKAYCLENSNLLEYNRSFKLTIELLEYFNDSIIDKLNGVRKELNIKDRDIKLLLYLLSLAQRKDTVVFRDTIFRDSLVNIDTILGDKWYLLNLGLRYPNTIITNPTFTSEKYIVVNYRKETINPPKKCIIARWFQRKHKVVEVQVIDKNPYITNKKLKFIEIINNKNR